MSKESNLFVDNLKASLQYMAPDSVALYKSRLSEYQISRDQWSKVLDALIDRNTDGKMPGLHDIRLEINKQIDNSKAKSNLGWAYFKLAGRDYAIRIKSENSQWIIVDLVSGGEHVQPHYGEPVAEHIPADATDYVIRPDNPARIEPHDVLQPEAVNKLVRETLARMGKPNRTLASREG